MTSLLLWSIPRRPPIPFYVAHPSINAQDNLGEGEEGRHNTHTFPFRCILPPPPQCCNQSRNWREGRRSDGGIRNGMRKGWGRGRAEVVSVGEKAKKRKEEAGGSISCFGFRTRGITNDSLFRISCHIDLGNGGFGAVNAFVLTCPRHTRACKKGENP